jgi:hypothetical protein
MMFQDPFLGVEDSPELAPESFNAVVEEAVL